MALLVTGSVPGTNIRLGVSTKEVSNDVAVLKRVKLNFALANKLLLKE
jgi:hypothetical protein